MITTDIDYPDSLPYPLREGQTVQTVQTFQRTQLTSGRARQRPRFLSTPTNYGVTWLFRSSAQAALFESWFRDELHGGASWFNAKLRTPAGGVGRYVCRFASMYSGPVSVGPDLWSVTASLEMWEKP